MLEFQCWNAGGKQSQTFSLCSLPHSSLTKEDMFAAVGEVLAAAAGVLYICCDNAGEHVYVKSFLLGLELPLHQEKLRALPFWRDVTFKSLPPHRLPRFDYRTAWLDRSNSSSWLRQRTCKKTGHAKSGRGPGTCASAVYALTMPPSWNWDAHQDLSPASTHKAIGKQHCSPTLIFWWPTQFVRRRACSSQSSGFRKTAVPGIRGTPMGSPR